MSNVKLTTLLAGAERLKRELQLTDPKTRANVAAAIQRNTKVVAAAARARAPKVSGVMASTIREEYSADGLIGSVKVGVGKLPRRSSATTMKGIARAKGRRRKVGPGAWAPVVERGDPRRGHKPHPFLMPPFVAQQPTAIKDITHALNDSLEEIT